MKRGRTHTNCVIGLAGILGVANRVINKRRRGRGVGRGVDALKGGK